MPTTMGRWALDLGTTNTGLARWDEASGQPQLVELPAILVDGNLRLVGTPSVMGLQGAIHANGSLDLIDALLSSLLDS